MRITTVLTLVAALVIASTPVLAETEAGRIVGVLKDPSGALVPGGQISIKNLDSGAAQSSTTDPQGRYSFDAVPAGRYQASATSYGLGAPVRHGITHDEGGTGGVEAFGGVAES